MGATVLGLVERGEWPSDVLMKELDKHLTRNHDRALFDLAPRPSATELGAKAPARRSRRDLSA